MNESTTTNLFEGCKYHAARECDLARVIEIELTGAATLHILRGTTPTAQVGATNAEIANSVKLQRVGDRLIVETPRSSGSASVSVNRGSSNVFVSGNGNVVAGGDLRIVGDGNVVDGNVIHGMGPIVVALVLSELKEVRVSGSGNAVLHDVQSPELELYVDGSGDIDASGRVTELSAHVHGSGDIKARKLQADRATLSITGSGDIRAQASTSVKAKITGSGDIVIYGQPPQRDAHVVGSGDIEFR